MATCSLDEYVKIWDISNQPQPKLIGYRKMAMGELFSLSFYKDIPWVLAAGGSKGEIAVWDIEENEQVKTHFSTSLRKDVVIDEPEEDEEDNFMDEEDDDEDSEEEKK